MTNASYDFMEDEQPNPPSPWKSILTLVLMVVLVIALLRFLMAFIVPLLSIVLLVANRDLVGRLFRMIVRLYQQETYKGLLATIAAVFLFTPFLVFLFFRTVYYLFVNPDREEGRLSIDADGHSLEDQIERLFREDNRRSY